MRFCKLFKSLFLSIVVLASLSACGGGGGGSTSSTAASSGTCATASNCTIPSAVSAIPPQN